MKPRPKNYWWNFRRIYCHFQIQVPDVLFMHRSQNALMYYQLEDGFELSSANDEVTT